VTLIVSLIGARGVVQACDRRTSWRPRKHLKEFDAFANKTVLFLAREAAVSMSYTGLAFLDDIPTDQWMAECLRGDPLPRQPGGEDPGMWQMVLGMPANWPSIDSALHRLTVELERAYGRLPADERGEPLHIVVVGVRWASDQAKPFNASIQKEATRLTFSLKWDTAAPIRGGRIIYAPAVHVSSARRKAMYARLHTLTLEETEAAFVELIRQIAEWNQAVGPHLTTVCIHPPRQGVIDVRFRSAPRIKRRKAVRGGGTQVAYSPWVISPMTRQAPTEVGGMGTTMVPFGPYQLRIHGPEAALGPRDDNVVAYVRSQPRRPTGGVKKPGK